MHDLGFKSGTGVVTNTLIVDSWVLHWQQNRLIFSYWLTHILTIKHVLLVLFREDIGFLPVHGPINREPFEKLYGKRPSGIRKL